MFRLLIIVCALACNGCATLGYYSQALRGQLDVITRAKPIDRVIADPATDAKLKAQLLMVREARDFAARELLLPDNDSYRNYSDLERPYALWNVFAAPALSLEAKTWCYPIAGCIAYRSYFAREPAERAAAELAAEGYDVHVGGVAAYSTAGWFDDPVLNTMLTYPDPEIAGILFHELGHQKLLAPGDTTFNESFAMTVEREGVRRWLARQRKPDIYPAYLERSTRHEAFIGLLMPYRQRLDELYRSTRSDDDKRAGKEKLLQALQNDYLALKKRWNGYDGYDKWMGQVNNAKFISVGLYHAYVPAFEALLRQKGGDLSAFYAAAEALAHEPPAVRDEKLRALGSSQER